MKFKNGIQLVLTTVLSFCWIMCSTTSPQMGTTGTPEVEETTPAEPSKDEDVLELLGIPSGEETAPDLDAVLQEKQDLEKRLSALESEVEDKDGEIARLRGELEQKSVKTSELEMLLTELQSGPPISDYERAYEAAHAAYQARDYESAIRDFEQLLQQDSNSSLSDNCQYWIGESYYGMGMHQKALLEFEKVFGFVDSNKDDAAQLKIALCYEKLHQVDNARDAIQRLLVKYPDSEYVDLAQQILARL